MKILSVFLGIVIVALIVMIFFKNLTIRGNNVTIAEQQKMIATQKDIILNLQSIHKP